MDVSLEGTSTRCAVFCAPLLPNLTCFCLDNKDSRSCDGATEEGGALVPGMP